MNAKEMMIEYATKHNTNSFDKLSTAEFCGKMITEGVVINRTASAKTIARVARTGSTITLTETTVTKTTKIVDGKVVESSVSDAVIIFEA